MGDTPVGAMRIELGLDASDFRTSLAGSERALKTFQAQVRGLDTALKSSGNNVGLLTNKQKALKNAIEAQKRVLQEYLNRHKSLEKGSAAWEANTREIEKQKAVLAGLEGQLQGVEKALEAVTKKTSFSEGLANVGKGLQTAGQKMQDLASKTKFISAGMAGAMTAGVKAAIEFESAMAGVNKTVDATPAQMKAIETGIRQMALEIPATTTEIAGVAEAAGQLGVATEDVLSFTRTMIDLSQATNMTSEQASTSLARFAKITDLVTQHGVEGYSRLGSAIVELGNNTATTESEIVDLGMRLAAAGTQVGLSQAEIMGLAASMSSVGLSAEAGGTAMSTIMTKINTAVAESGERLGEFASIAGMTAEEFATLWKDKPTEALELFTKGLGEALESGENVDAMLRELGVNGIRETDAIKRLGLAHKDLADNFEMANKAFGENSALSKEASQRYETNASKIQILKNKLHDVAIELGGPLAEALASALDAGQPMIDWLARMARKFTSLDKDTQRLWVSIATGVAVFSPVMKTMGIFTSGLGSLVTTLASAPAKFDAVKTALGALRTGSSVATTAVSTFGSGVATATGKVGLLAKGTALLGGTGMAALVVGAGVAGVALAIYGAKVGEVNRRHDKWGEVSLDTANHLEGLKDRVNDVSLTMDQFGTGMPDNLENAKQAVDNLAGSIGQLADEQLQAKLKELQETISDPEIYKEAAEKATAYYNQVKQDAEATAQVVNAIYDRASQQKRELSEQERLFILENTKKMMQDEIALLDEGTAAKTELMKLAAGEMVSLTEEQWKDVKKHTEQAIKEENEAYENRKSQLREQWKQGFLDKEQYQAELSRLDAEHTATIDHWTAMQTRALASQLKAVKKNTGEQGEAYENALTVLKTHAQQMGIAWEDVTATAEGGGKKLSSLMLGLKDSSQEAVDALLMWQGIVLDDKTAELKTNVKDAIKESLAAENGWANLQFMVKHADLTSNAQIEIARAIKESGRWDELTPEEKALILDAQEAVAAISDSTELYETWNALPMEVKEFLADNTIFMHEGNTAKEFLENWDSYTPEEKELIAKDLTSGDVDSAQRAIDNVKQGQPVEIKAKDDTKPVADTADKNVNAPKQNKPINMLATDNASSVASEVNRNVNAVPTSWTTTFNAVLSGAWNAVKGFVGLEKGTDYHAGGLAMVNDQKGALYKELVTLPSGESFIPEGRDVVLPLPRGSKVLTATRTRNLMNKLGIPKYADGVGIPEDAKFLRDIERARPRSNRAGQTVIDMREVVDGIEQMERSLGRLLKAILLKDNDVYIDGEKATKTITRFQEKRTRLDNRMKGVIT